MPREDTAKVPAALEKYRVQRDEPQTKAVAAKPLRGELEPFARKVRAAIKAMERAAKWALEDPGGASSVPRISVTSVMARAGSGRSQLYEEYPYLLDEIRDAATRVQEAAKSRGRVVPKSKVALERALRAERKKTRLEVRRIASVQLTEITKRLGPEFQRRERYVAVIRELRARLAASEQARETQAEINRALMIEANRKR